jgi:alpha-tubulin suppressor-like RCC1 family protein
MKNYILPSLCTAILLVVTGCGDDTTTTNEDSGVEADGGPVDASRRDAAPREDADVPGPDAMTDIDATLPPDSGVTSCEDGFELIDGECIDINECELDTDTCDALVTCTNTSGSFTCGACPSGYEGEGATGCTDIDECELETDLCDALVTCNNTPGSYTCGDCPEGYMGGDGACVDIDECMMDVCSDLVTCDNTEPGFMCGACPDGYTGDGESCTDIDECAVPTDPCGENGTCGNVDGSFECTCDEGYALVDGVCTDINECTAGTATCVDNSTCSNTAGAYDCPCNEGFRNNEGACVDINECEESSNACGDNASCENTTGGFDCTCITGFEKVDGACVDINECITGDFTCASGRVCSNTAGSYECALGMTQVFAGTSHACAISADNKARCWGENGNGQLGYNDTTDRGLVDGSIESLTPYNFSTFLTIDAAVGDGFSCFLNRNTASTNFAVRCFGKAAFGVLGTSVALAANVGDATGETATNFNFTTGEFGTTSAPRRIVAGSNHVCALFADGSVKCWGDNRDGQLGIGNTNQVGGAGKTLPGNSPFVDFGSLRAQQITAGDGHTCALLSDSSVRCWGRNANGQLGRGNTFAIGDQPSEMGSSLAAVDLGTGFVPVQVEAGDNHTCALSDAGKVKCWGDNTFGQLSRASFSGSAGDASGEMGDALPFVELGDFVPVSIDVGAISSCALSSSGDMVCWGDNGFGQLGIGSFEPQGTTADSIVSVTQGSLVTTRTAVGNRFMCALFGSPGGIRCWGGNSAGALGIPGVTGYGAVSTEAIENLSALPFSPL